MDNKDIKYPDKISHGAVLTHRVTLIAIIISFFLGLIIGGYLFRFKRDSNEAYGSILNGSILKVNKNKNNQVRISKILPTPPSHSERYKKVNTGQWPTVKAKTFSVSYPLDWGAKKEGDNVYFDLRPNSPREPGEPKGDITMYTIANPTKLSMNNFFDGKKAPNYFAQARGGVLDIKTEKYKGKEFVGVLSDNIWVLDAEGIFIVLDDGFGINPVLTQIILNTVNLLK